MRFAPKNLFDKFFKYFPMVVVEVVIKNPKGILLTKRDIEPYKGYWHLPGGFVRYREAPEKAVLRVAKKETGLRVKINKFLGVSNYKNMPKREHLIALYYLAKPTGGKIKGSKEGEEICYFKKLPNKMISHHKRSLKGLKLI